MVGGVLLGLATRRAGVFPPRAGLLLLIDAVSNPAVFLPLPDVMSSIIGERAALLFLLGLVWMGSRS
jgi:hypothetical protein